MKKQIELGTQVWAKGEKVGTVAKIVADPETSVEKGMAILDTTGLKIGEVNGLVMDSDKQQIIQILLRQPGPRNTRHRIIPVDLVTDVKAGMVHLRITAEYVYGLDFYEPEQM